MYLSSLENFEIFLGQSNDGCGCDTSNDTQLSLALAAASAAIQKYCKRDFFRTNRVEYPFRLGGEAIVPLQPPVLSYRLTGNITNGQPTITGLSSTSNLIVGMTAIVASGANQQTTQPFPNAAGIVSVDSSSQVTMSGNATQNVSGATVIFGLSMWADPNGVFGDGPGTDPTGPFGPTTLLYPGIDYSLQRDASDGMTSKSGKIIRLGGTFGFLGMAGAWTPFGGTWSGLNARGTLTANLKPLWPNWPPGSIRILYCSGFATIPQDVQAACNGLAAWILRNATTGLVQVQSESASFGASLSIGVESATAAIGSIPALGSVRSLLRPWRIVSI